MNFTRLTRNITHRRRSVCGARRRGRGRFNEETFVVAQDSVPAPPQRGETGCEHEQLRRPAGPLVLREALAFDAGAIDRCPVVVDDRPA